MKGHVVTERVVKDVREAVFSDFSGRELPSMHWSTVTKFEAGTFDGAGNKTRTWELDLMPEEMADFVAGLNQLVASLTEKYRSRMKGGVR